MKLEEIIRIDREFFKKHQRALLWFVNSRLGRWFFRIQEHPLSRKFVEIHPNALVWKSEDKNVAEFRTANRYANRLKTSLSFIKTLAKLSTAFGIKQLSHAAEAAFWLSPILIVGATGTFYPDADTETTSVDGNATRTPGGLGAGTSWAAIIAGAGTSKDDSTAGELAGRWSADNVSNQWRILTRGFFLFDTSALTSGASVSAVTFSVYISSRTTPTDATASKRELRVVSSNPASNTALANADFSTLGATEFGHITYSTATDGAYNDVSLNASGISNVSLTGISKFGTKLGADMDASAPTWASFDTCSYQIRFAEQAGTSSDPKLTVTYTATTTSTITKGLQYAIKTTPATVTKGMQYVIQVVTSSTKTKSLQYVIKSSPTLTKALQYAIKTNPTAITKAAQYRINVPVTITKALQYVINYVPYSRGIITGVAKRTNISDGTQADVNRGNKGSNGTVVGTKL